MVSTQCSTQMVYYRIAHSKHIMLLTKVTPINLRFLKSYTIKISHPSAIQLSDPRGVLPCYQVFVSTSVNNLCIYKQTYLLSNLLLHINYCCSAFFFFSCKFSWENLYWYIKAFFILSSFLKNDRHL